MTYLKRFRLVEVQDEFDIDLFEPNQKVEAVCNTVVFTMLQKTGTINLGGKERDLHEMRIFTYNLN